MKIASSNTSLQLSIKLIQVGIQKQNLLNLPIHLMHSVYTKKMEILSIWSIQENFKYSFF